MSVYSYFSFWAVTKETRRNSRRVAVEAPPPMRRLNFLSIFFSHFVKKTSQAKVTNLSLGFHT